MNRTASLSNIVHRMRVVELSGGVGGARMARGLAALEHVDLTVVVNVGDDEEVHGLHISPDLDTVIYTLAGMEGQEGWGRAGDTFSVNDELARFGIDNRFRLGDHDLALSLFRTQALSEGRTLSEVTEAISLAFGVATRVIPATDDPVRTRLRLGDGWTAFQDYFVLRGNQDTVEELAYAGADEATPAAGAIEAIDEADVIVIGPSNPPLSIWPILAIEGFREALERHRRVVAVSPLIGGRALKGPADRVMSSLGLPPGNAGVVAAYQGLADVIVVDQSDRDQPLQGLEVMVADTRIPDSRSAARLAREVIGS